MKVAVIGAGASGLMASLFASKNNDVVVFDGNSDAGKKLLLTGNGRCNIGNVNNDLCKYHSSSDELIKQVINEQNINKVRNVFENIGLVIKNKNGYLYPFSEKSNSILSVLKNACINNNVKFKFNTIIEKVERVKEKFLINDEEFDKVIITTGGCSYPKTGSTGIGYFIASSFGHNIAPLNPSLMPVITNIGLEKDWAGKRCEVLITLLENDRKIKQEHGEIQFTNYGLSGICIFNLSRNIALGLKNGLKEEISINFVPWLNDESFETFIENKRISNKTTFEVCDGFLDYKITEILLKYLKINKNKKWNELSHSEKNNFCNALKNFKVEVIGTKDYLDAQVTSGGINLNEINLDTMESKLVKNLYFAGEVLDLDGDCGGYNLTIAFITGLLAGEK